METGKTTKYFKYAIGEITLVVIGILIALQINNWNETKKTKEKEKQVLTEILSDLKYNIADIGNIINKKGANLKGNIHSIKILINILQSDLKYHDSLSRYFSSTNNFDFADYKTSGFQSLTSIGMDLIADPEIRSSIGEFYTSSIAGSQLAYNEVRDDYYNYMLDYYRNDFTTYLEGPYKSRIKPNDFEALKNKSDYIQSLRSFLGVNIFYYNTINSTQDSAILLKENIEKYIN